MAESKRVIEELARGIKDPFKHVVLGQVDDYCAYLTRIEGAYLYHQHSKDEMYVVLDGELGMDYDDGTNVTVNQGETLVVRAGEKHRSRSEQGALVLMFKSRAMFAE